MARRSRIRRPLKWIATFICGLFLLIYLASFVWYFRWEKHPCYCDIRSGWVEFEYLKGWPGTGPGIDAGWNFERRTRWFQLTTSYTPTWAFSGWRVYAPLWPVVPALFAPTLLLWWFGRASLPLARCQKCGYNLTGNVSGQCPECGAPTRKTEGG